MQNAIHTFTVSRGFDANLIPNADVEIFDLYFLEGDLSVSDQQRLASSLLSDPVVQVGSWQAHANEQCIDVILRPGVTDPVAEHVLHGAKLLGLAGVQRAATGVRYKIRSEYALNLTEIAEQYLVNPVIQHYTLGPAQTIFPTLEATNSAVEMIALRDLSATQLQELATVRRTALDLAEMQAVQNYYREQQRDATDVELETIAQTWSEHCNHKTFRANIQYGDQQIPGLLKSYIRRATEEIAAPWVASAFVDNAGIIDFDDEYQLAFKAETHNHPSAIEPFGGANTGVGGVMRDVMGVSAKPIANTDVLCFGPEEIDTLPEGTLHPRRIRAGVIAGVQDYGNKTGVPTVNGTIWYDPGYTANPLVYCGCIGLLKKNSHPRAPKIHNRVIVIGGRTGRDGLRGATFSSMTMDAQTGAVAGASVQIGNPIIAKGLIEVITRASAAKLYDAITDCGAGGLSSAVGEMASELGADVDLAKVPLKYAGLAPWEIWLSEAQERMVMSVAPEKLADLQAICDLFDIELTDIGAFTDTQELVVRFQDNIVLRLHNAFLFEGNPLRSLIAQAPIAPAITVATVDTDFNASLLRLLNHPNIRSKQDTIRLYDHEVQGATVIKPLVGIKNDGPSDAAVLKPLVCQGKRGLVVANGLNPEIGKYDAHAMAVSVIDEAIRNCVAVGADPARIAILDNFCWGDPKRPTTLGALVEAAKGCYDAAMHYQAPFISGKDSLNNEYVAADQQRHAIPGTLLISALAIIEDIDHAVSMDFKAAGNKIYLLGETHAQFAGSHYALCHDGVPEHAQQTPSLPAYGPALYHALHQAMQQKLVAACHDLSEGGFAVALAEMAIAGRLGCAVELSSADAVVALFSESNGRMLVEVAPQHATAFEALLQGQPLQVIGEVVATPQVNVTHQQQSVISLGLSQLNQAFFGRKVS